MFGAGKNSSDDFIVQPGAQVATWNFVLLDHKEPCHPHPGRTPPSRDFGIPQVSEHSLSYFQRSVSATALFAHRFTMSTLSLGHLSCDLPNDTEDEMSDS